MLDEKETKENLRNGFPADRKPYTDNYDYDADGDLEEGEDRDSSSVKDSQVVLEKGETDESGSGVSLGSQTPDAEGDESSDVVSASDVDSPFSDPVDTKPEAEATATHIGTVVVIDDVAFVTWVCFPLSCHRLSDPARQIPGAASLFVYE